MRATAASMFGKRNGSLRERRRGTRNRLTSSAEVKRLRFSSSTMQGRPQISAQLMPLSASAHAGAMIQCLSKFIREGSGIKGSVHFGVVIEINIDVALSCRCRLSIGYKLRVVGLSPLAPVPDPVRPPIQFL